MKKKIKKDPHATREGEKYSHPIPSRELILQYLNESDQPLDIEKIARILGLEDEQDLEALRRRLHAMERDGQLIQNRRGGFGVINKMDLIRGRVIGHPDGFGFLTPDDGGDDLFLSPKQMRSLLHGDRALVRVTGIDRRNRREGAVVEVLERANKEIVGRYFIESGVGFVVSSNKRISQEVVVPVENQGEAKAGQIVVAAIIEYPTRHSQPVGKITEVLGEHMAPGMEMEIAIRTHGLPQDWPAAVEDEMQLFTTEVPDEACQGREDIRELPLVTIDGEDSRDFDDAVYCERDGKGWRLLVAIADVSSYVEPGTALDKEAWLRGNSVYFPDNVIPMLPEILSNGLCSLNPEVNRLSLVCELSFNEKGKILKHRFFEAMMRSHARLTYNKVAAMLIERNAELCREYNVLLPHLETLYALYKVLRKTREKRGAIDFDTAETRIVFGAERKIEKIIPVVRNDAHKLIEECMIAANIAAAEFLHKHKIPCLYRVHQPPPAEKLIDVREFLGEFGLRLGGGAEPEPKDYEVLLTSISERPDRHLIETVLLRSLSRAVYHPVNEGHFGLALSAYAHFTSPIRRYPDLLVHRGIRHVLAGGKPETFIYSVAEMQTNGDQASITERRADEATRDATDWLKCEYMMSRVGETFSGMINTVTSFGMFVELDDVYVEGLIHITALDNDYYHFDPIKHRLVGERTGRSYRLADKIEVKVARVDLDEKKIDFILAESELDGQSSKGKKDKGSRGGPKKSGRENPNRKKAGENKNTDKKSTHKRSSGKKTAKKKAAGEQATSKKTTTKRRRKRSAK